MNPADLFKNDTNPTVLATGEVLFHEGDSGDCMYVVLEGSLDVVVAGKSVFQATRGAILGELALVDGSPRAATVIATEDSRLSKVDERRFDFLIQQNLFFAKQVMKTLAERIRLMNQYYAGK